MSPYLASALCWVETTIVSMRLNLEFSYSAVTWLLASGLKNEAEPSFFP